MLGDLSGIQAADHYLARLPVGQGGPASSWHSCLPSLLGTRQGPDADARDAFPAFRELRVEGTRWRPRLSLAVKRGAPRSPTEESSRAPAPAGPSLLHPAALLWDALPSRSRCPRHAGVSSRPGRGQAGAGLRGVLEQGSRWGAGQGRARPWVEGRVFRRKLLLSLFCRRCFSGHCEACYSPF